jgi:hypothetical protein
MVCCLKQNNSETKQTLPVGVLTTIFVQFKKGPGEREKKSFVN